MKNKYLFLDFDGILNSNKNYRTLQMLGIPTRDECGTIFDLQYVEYCWNLLFAKMFGQLNNRESLRYLILALETHQEKTQRYLIKTLLII